MVWVFVSDSTTLKVVPSTVVTVNQRVTLQCISDNKSRSTKTVQFHIQSDYSPNCTLAMIPLYWKCIVIEHSCEVLYMYNGFCPSDIEYSLEINITMHWNGAVVFCQDVYGQSDKILFIVSGAVMIEIYMIEIYMKYLFDNV